MAEIALSIKQPWAALLVRGVKTIEVRAWPTARRGRVYIHAGRIPDERPEGWALVPPPVKELADFKGGLIGVADLVGCKAYRNAARFAADQVLHLNDPSWFKEPALYGFMFKTPSVLAFQRCPGWFRFFEVEVTPPAPPARKLVIPP